MSDNAVAVDYVDVLLRNKKRIALATLICALAAVAGYFIMPKTYESGLVLEVGIISYASAKPSTKDSVTETIEPVEVVRDEIMSKPFAAVVIRKLGLETTPDKLSKNIKARINEDIRSETAVNRQVIVTVKAKSPEQAKALADTIAELIIQKHEEIYKQALENRLAYEDSLQKVVDDTSAEIKNMEQKVAEMYTKGNPNTASLVLLHSNIQDKLLLVANLKRELSQAKLLNKTNLKSANTSVTMPSYLPSSPRTGITVYIIVGLMFGAISSTCYYTAAEAIRMRRPPGADTR